MCTQLIMYMQYKSIVPFEKPPSSRDTCNDRWSFKRGMWSLTTARGGTEGGTYTYIMMDSLVISKASLTKGVVCPHIRVATQKGRWSVPTKAASQKGWSVPTKPQKGGLSLQKPQKGGLYIKLTLRHSSYTHQILKQTTNSAAHALLNRYNTRHATDIKSPKQCKATVYRRTTHTCDDSCTWYSDHRQHMQYAVVCVIVHGPT